jgi:hypothetical protein
VICCAVGGIGMVRNVGISAVAEQRGQAKVF